VYIDFVILSSDALYSAGCCSGENVCTYVGCVGCENVYVHM